MKPAATIAKPISSKIGIVWKSQGFSELQTTSLHSLIIVRQLDVMKLAHSGRLNDF